MIELVAAGFALTAPLQGAPPDIAAAETALRAAVAAIDSGKVDVVCYPNSLYREDEPCDAPEVNIRALDLRRLVRFEVASCASKGPQSRCAEFLFDRGRGDGGITNLELATDSVAVRTADDIKAIRITQWRASRD